MPQVRVLRTGQTAFVPFSEGDGGKAAKEALDKFVNQLRDLGFGADASETAVNQVAQGTKTPTQAATSITPKKTGTGGNRPKKPAASKKLAASVLRKVGKALQKAGNKKKK